MGCSAVAMASWSFKSDMMEVRHVEVAAAGKEEIAMLSHSFTCRPFLSWLPETSWLGASIGGLGVRRFAISCGIEFFFKNNVEEIERKFSLLENNFLAHVLE